jgi:membrane-associated phospholipid phosphatase
MPSGHTAVAFGAAAMLCRLHPSAWPVWLAIATGCGVTRILARAHYLSDVVAGAFVGLAAGAIIWSLHLRVLRRSGVHR